MKCPVCFSPTLKPIQLDSHLKALYCHNCEGKWLSAADYWDWLDKHGDTLPEKEPESLPIETADVQRAKLCPRCRRIMLRYQVGHGLTFALDQCDNCNGFWFDANEWEALRECNLHDEVHLIFSAPWQAQLRKTESRQFLESLYAQSFKDDYEKTKHIKAWIDQHPEKDMIQGYLTSADPYSTQTIDEDDLV